MKKDGLLQGKVHDSLVIIKVIDGVPHIADREKGKYKWVPTVMEETRLKKFRPISEAEIASLAIKLSFSVKGLK